MTEQKIFRLVEVISRVGLRKSQIYKMIRAGDFPRPAKLTGKAVGWHRHEIDEWLLTRPRAESSDNFGCVAPEVVKVA